jgi:hypothetical protein
MHNRPAQESEYQQAYDRLTQQAIGFAQSLTPTTLSEFADYFELYWTMADHDCLFHRGDRTYEAAFIAQVQTLGESDDWSQAKAEVSNPLRSLVRSIALKFGRPDELGCREWIGFGSLQTLEPVEQMIRAIQVQSAQRRVLFESLSWGVLQVYQNGGELLQPEQKLGRNLVVSYLLSARLTIEQPTEPVACDPSSIEFYEFRFERLIEDGSGGRIGIAQVRVSRASRRVILYRYGFKQR